MRTRTKLLIVSIAAAVFALSAAGAAFAVVPPVNLGSTSTFAVLAYGVENAGVSKLTGDIGYWHLTDTGTLTVTGATFIGPADSKVETAFADLHTAYDDAAGRTPTALVTTELGSAAGQVLLPGVYRYDGQGSLVVTGTLILDAQGDPDAVWVFQAPFGLETSEHSVIKLANGARFCRVFWQVVRNADLGVDSTFVGHLLASGTIDAELVTVEGQLLSYGEANIYLYDSTVTNAICTKFVRLPTTGYPPAPAAPWQLPFAAFGAGAVALLIARRRVSAAR